MQQRLVKAYVKVDAANYSNMENSLRKRADKESFHLDLELIIKEWSGEQNIDLERIWYTGIYPKCPFYTIRQILAKHNWRFRKTRAVFCPKERKYKANVDEMIIDDIMMLPNLRSKNHKNLIVLLTGDRDLSERVLNVVSSNIRNKVLVITTLREKDTEGKDVNGRGSYRIQRLPRIYPNFTFKEYEDLVDLGKIRTIEIKNKISKPTEQGKIELERCKVLI